MINDKIFKIGVIVSAVGLVAMVFMIFDGGWEFGNIFLSGIAPFLAGAGIALYRYYMMKTGKNEKESESSTESTTNDMGLVEDTCETQIDGEPTKDERIVFDDKKDTSVSTDSERIELEPEIKITVKRASQHEDREQVGILSCLDFGKPNGELGCFLNYCEYKIRGTDEKGKKGLIVRSGVDAQHAIEKAKAAGLVAPFEVEPIAYEPPTERQLNYLKDLGVFIPEGITKTDASYMISRAVGEDSMEGPRPSMVALAVGLKVEFSAFVGADELFRSIVYQSSGRDRAALYAYGVRQNARGNSFRNMLEDPDLSVFYAFADQVVTDSALMRSLKERSAEDFKKPYRGTLIYKAAADYLSKEKKL